MAVLRIFTMSLASDGEAETTRTHQKEALNHEFIVSEDIYVSELDALLTHVINPLTINAHRCHLKQEEIIHVCGLMKHMLDFHEQFVRMLHSEIYVYDRFEAYIAFLQLYHRHLQRFTRILQIISEWSKSMAFREFTMLRLQNTRVSKFIDGRLCSLPYHLYRPLLRCKEYYRFFKRVEKLTSPSDAEWKKVVKCKNALRIIYSKIRKRDSHITQKSRLLEIQLQVFDNPQAIVSDDRHFVYHRMCEQERSGFGKQWKLVHLYIFNDCLLWCSRRGQFKQGFRFEHCNLLYGAAESTHLFIQYGSNEQHHKNAPKSTTRKMHMLPYAPSTKKFKLAFASESIRDYVVQLTRRTHLAHLEELQSRMRHHTHEHANTDHFQMHLQNIIVMKSNSNSKSNLGSHFRDHSLTLSQTWTEDSSIYFAEFLAQLGPLESHQNENQKMSRSSSLVGHEELRSDETDESQSQLSLKALNTLKQSVTVNTEITTIEEEDECEHVDEEMKAN